MSTWTPAPPTHEPARPSRPSLPPQRGGGRLSGAGLAVPGMVDDVHPRRSVRLLTLLVVSVVTGLVLALLMLPLVGGIGLTAKTTADDFNTLPTELVVPPLPERSVLLDRTGKPIADFHGAEDRVNVPFERIPVSMRQAIVAIEDRRFYDHHGIDYKGVLRAAISNQESGEVTQGGSTLTQQYVKNVLITIAATDAGKEAAQERSVRRKLREARYALALEKTLTKDQILTNYLNIAYFGDGAYGVAAAAQHYFGKDISAINPIEAATLAGLVQNPNVYNPKLHPKEARERRNAVLTAMRDAGYLTQPAFAFASASRVQVRKTIAVSDGCESGGSDAFFCQYVRQTLLDDPSFGPTPEERQRKLFEGGLRIQTTLDPVVQTAAQSAADATIPAGNRVASAVVILQPGTGEVQGMAINRVYGNTSDKKPVETTADRVHTKLNYALRPFQPGSTFKVFTLAAALDSGIPLSTTINAPNCYRSRTLNNPADGCYHNASDGEGGVFPMPQATWHSVNTYFVQLEERVGVLKVRDMAKRLGLTSPLLDQVGSADGSLTLGTIETTPMEMATAYAALAAHGKRCTAKPVLDVVERNKTSSYQGPGSCEQVLDPAVADTVSSVLTGTIREGTAARNGPIGRPAAGKTGTTEQNRSAWFVGYVPQLAAAVWVGDYRSPDTFPLRYSPTTPEGVPVPGWGGGTVFGGDLPTEVWSRAMRAAVANLPIENFPPPDRIVARGVVTGVPSVAGQSLSSAFETLRAAGFHPVNGGRVNSGTAAGLVAYTSPGAGADVAPGATVSVFVSNGYVAPAPVAPPPSPSPAASSPLPTPSPRVIPSPRPLPSASPRRPTPKPSPSRTVVKPTKKPPTKKPPPR